MSELLENELLGIQALDISTSVSSTSRDLVCNFSKLLVGYSSNKANNQLCRFEQFADVQQQQRATPPAMATINLQILPDVNFEGVEVIIFSYL